MNINCINALADDRCPSHSGILANICKGERWMDSENNPELAVTYSYCVGGCGIFGYPLPLEAAQKFLGEVFDALKKKEIYEFEFSCEEKELTQWVLHVFEHKEIHKEMELSYRYLKQSRLENIDTAQEQYMILPITEMLLNDLNTYENDRLLRDRFFQSWELHSFAANSLGFVAVHEKSIVGVILGTGRYKDYLAIDIEVEKKFRRMGIAKNLSKCFISECQKNHIIPQWDCVESNVASQKLAQKAGFELFKKRPYYWFEI